MMKIEVALIIIRYCHLNMCQGCSCNGSVLFFSPHLPLIKQ